MKKLVFIFMFFISMFASDESETRKIFEEKFAKWYNHASHPDVTYSAEWSLKAKNKDYYEIVDMGVVVIPFIIEKIESKKKSVSSIRSALFKILKYKSNTLYNRETKKVIFIDFPEYNSKKKPFFDFWWYKGRKKIPQTLKTRYEEYKQLKSRRDVKGAEEKLQKIQNLGYDGLPVMIEMVKSGEVDLIPVISRLTASEKRGDVNLPASARAEEVLQWWEKNKERFLVPVVE